MSNLGNKIKAFRVEKGLSQLELGNMLCVSDKTISSWENDRTIPDINFIFQMAKIFHTSFYALAYEDYCNLNNVELELKIKLDEDEWNKLQKFIKSNSTYLGDENHSAVYYYPEHRELESEWLRVRNQNGTFVLNYKKWVDINCCEEYETIIDNPDNFEKILFSMGFKKLGVIDKVRIGYLYEDKYKISFDIVKDIGLFMEIEVKKPTMSHADECAELMNLLNKFNIDVSKVETKRYPDYLKRSE